MSELASVILPRPSATDDASRKVQLSEHFWLHEFSVSGQFPELALGVPDAVVPAVTRLAVGLLQPWRDEIGRIRITSGFRSAALNDALRGSDTSQHLRGEAGDCVPEELSLPAAWSVLWAMGHGGALDAGQVIYYPANGFIHVAVPSRRYPTFTPCVRWRGAFPGYPVADDWAEFCRLAHVRLPEPPAWTPRAAPADAPG